MKSKFLVGIFALGASSLFANLISNPGFEQSVMGGTLQIVPVADTFITDWTVSGAPLLLLASNYTEAGGTLLFPSNSGNQHLDITGAGNTGNGSISQDVATNIGVSYMLSFWVGNQDDNASGYGNTSLIRVFVDGADQGTFGHSDDTPNQTTWRQFSLGFTATSGSTSIRFENATTSDNMAGLDDVDLVAVSASVPEPGTLAMCGLALLGLAGLRRRA